MASMAVRIDAVASMVSTYCVCNSLNKALNICRFRATSDLLLRVVAALADTSSTAAAANVSSIFFIL